MNRRIGWDIVLNIIVPILLGIVCYQAVGVVTMPTLISNHLADGLWAYAFLSAILIIWNRRVNLPWVVATFSIAAGLEMLQHWQLIEGTGDLYDVLTYFLFFIIALQFNQTFKTRFRYHNQN